MATKKELTKTVDLIAEVDVTPPPNIRLIKGQEPIGVGELRVGMRSAGLVPEEDKQIAGWYTSNAAAIREALPTKFEGISYDRVTGEELVKDCVNC